MSELNYQQELILIGLKQFNSRYHQMIIKDQNRSWSFNWTGIVSRIIRWTDDYFEKFDCGIKLYFPYADRTAMGPTGSEFINLY